jgi:hypothetical protein
MSLSLGLAGVEAGALKHDVHPYKMFPYFQIAVSPD